MKRIIVIVWNKAGVNLDERSAGLQLTLQKCVPIAINCGGSVLGPEIQVDIVFPPTRSTDGFDTRIDILAPIGGTDAHSVLIEEQVGLEIAQHFPDGHTYGVSMFVGTNAGPREFTKGDDI